MHTSYKTSCEILIPNSFPKVRKYGRPMESLNQCRREHPRRIRTQHLRDKRMTSQIDRFV